MKRLLSIGLNVGLALAAIVASVSTASATMRIAEDRGGQIGHYMRTFAQARSTGERVIIDGNCLSACTLVLGLVPRDRICATPRARFGFHAAWMPDAYGRPITSEVGTQALWDMYPPRVRSWIARNGGLSRQMIFLQGRALTNIIPSCDAPSHKVVHTESFRDAALKTLGDARASATRRRH